MAETLDGGPTDGGERDAALPPPEPLLADESLPQDRPRFRDTSGVELTARWVWQNVPKAAQVPEANTETIDAARQASVPRWQIVLTDAGRMRVQFVSRALPLPEGAELRSRVERSGTIVVWPKQTKYRIVPVGSLRTALSDRRVDVTPLSVSQPKEGEPGKRLGLETRTVELMSALATVRLELARLTESARGAVVLCRTLVEIGGVDPGGRVCAAGELVLVAEFSWVNGGGVRFEVETASRVVDLRASELLMPPPGARLVSSGLPTPSEGALFTREELAAFRTEPVAPPEPADPRAPTEGLTATNSSDLYLYVLLDGVAVDTVPPWTDRHIVGPKPGRYSVQWRTFLGEVVTSAQDLHVPAWLGYGVMDAGAPARAPDAG